MQPERDDYHMLVDIAGRAGEVAMGYFGGPNPSWTKSRNSPVSKADLETDRFLREALLAERPDYGWLSEETDDDHDRLGRKRVFVVDPIDGTRGFLDGNPHWCVSAAIVEDDRPVVGVLVCPALGRVLSAKAGMGSFLNGERLLPPVSEEVVRVAASKKLGKQLEQDYGDRISVAPFIPSLAYRIALVATGEVDGAFARGGAHEWDLAAADLILTEAGGSLVRPDGRRLSYNAPQLRMPGLIASAPGRRERLAALAREGGFLH